MSKRVRAKIQFLVGQRARFVLDSDLPRGSGGLSLEIAVDSGFTIEFPARPLNATTWGVGS